MPAAAHPVAESIAVLALSITQVQCHDTAIVLDAKCSECPAPDVNSILEGEVRVSGLGGVTCSHE